MKNNWLFSPNGQGMTISIGIHLSVLALVHCMKSTSASAPFTQQAYTITLQSNATYRSTKHPSSTNELQKQIEVAHRLPSRINEVSENKIKNKCSRLKQHSKNQPIRAKVPPNITRSDKVPRIDERGLYKSGKNCTKKADATLELTGWEWDAVPNPRDTTEECGKIVFKIKVDKDGEIISIETIEKTVTPMVEKIYADALRALTFSKTVEMPSSISTGKVTFVLVAK